MLRADGSRPGPRSRDRPGEASGEQIGRLRRSYRLTEAGGDALTAETARLDALRRRAQLVLRAHPAGPFGFAPCAVAGAL